jgi:hypothetical protein
MAVDQVMLAKNRDLQRRADRVMQLINFGIVAGLAAYLAESPAFGFFVGSFFIALRSAITGALKEARHGE